MAGLNLGSNIRRDLRPAPVVCLSRERTTARSLSSRAFGISTKAPGARGPPRSGAVGAGTISALILLLDLAHTSR